MTSSASQPGAPPHRYGDDYTGVSSAFQPGATLYAYGDDNVVVPLKLASLFKIAGDENVYALTGRSDQRLKNCKRIATRMMPFEPAGTLAAPNPLSREGDAATDLFSVIELDKSVSKDLMLAEAEISNIDSSDIFGKHPITLRKIVVSASHQIPTGQNHPPQRRYVHGFVSGKVVQPDVPISADQKNVTLPRAILAGSWSARRPKLAEAGDSGSPLISGSNRLLGFIVGQKDNETLVMLAIDLAKAYGMTFLSPRTENSAVRLKPGHIEP